MKIAYFDCIGGASGDMILGALLDAGLPLKKLERDLSLLNLGGYRLVSRKVDKNGFQATRVDVIVNQDVPERRLIDILGLVENGQLPEEIKNRAVRLFTRLGEIEAGIHGKPLDQVHLHELGGVDTMVDVIGTFLGMCILEVEKSYASPLPMGRGFTRGAHGPIPLPAPATLALLKGVPIIGSEIDFELVTPTGAALLTSLAESFGSIPPMILQQIGYGAGGRDLPIPNVLRVLLGEATRPPDGTVETLVLLETNIDDLNPQLYEYVMDRLMAGGALDVTLSPVQMKKNRPAVQLSVLCRQTEAPGLEAILFAETSTLGVRKSMIERHALRRSFRMVETPYGPVQVKIALWGEGHWRAAPEYEYCRKLAETSGIPLLDVYRAAIAAIETDPSGGMTAPNQGL